MDNSTRLTYLRSEVRVWNDRVEKALRSDNPGLKELYLDFDLGRVIGNMLAEIRQLEEELGMTDRRPVGKRRPAGQKVVEVVQVEEVVEEVEEAPVLAGIGCEDLF
jgi:hypothetical protein